jgi:hypothetical protein
LPKSHSFKIRFKNLRKLVKTTTTTKKQKRKRKRKVPSLFMKNAAAAAIYAGTDDAEQLTPQKSRLAKTGESSGGVLKREHL